MIEDVRMAFQDLWDVVPHASFVQYKHPCFFSWAISTIYIVEMVMHARGQMFAPTNLSLTLTDNLTKDFNSIHLMSFNLWRCLINMIQPTQVGTGFPHNTHHAPPAPHPMMPRWHHLHPYGIGIHFPSVRIQDRNQRHHNTSGRRRGILGQFATKHGSLKTPTPPSPPKTKHKSQVRL